MNVAYRQKWTQEDFLAWVEHQEERYEFDGVRPVLVNGGSVNHSRIMRNVLIALQSQLRGSTFEALGPSIGIETLNGAIRYPDVLVFKGPILGTALKIANVVATFEVSSPSTAKNDRTIKLREYAAVPSLLQYVLVEQSFAGVTVYSRADARLPWTTEGIAELDGSVKLPHLGVKLPLRAIYEGVDLP